MTSPPRRPATPTPSRALGDALAGNEPLAGLLQRVGDSRRRLEAVAHLLPHSLRDNVRAGPLDDSAWLLLAGNAAAAAKLRQLLPALQAALQAAGWQGPEIKVKIQPLSAPR